MTKPTPSSSAWPRGLTCASCLLLQDLAQLAQLCNWIEILPWVLDCTKVTADSHSLARCLQTLFSTSQVVFSCSLFRMTLPRTPVFRRPRRSCPSQPVYSTSLQRHHMGKHHMRPFRSNQHPYALAKKRDLPRGSSRSMWLVLLHHHLFPARSAANSSSCQPRNGDRIF